MNVTQRFQIAEDYLRRLIELRGIEQQGVNAPYDEQRRVRREAKRLWEDARVHLELVSRMPLEPAAQAEADEPQEGTSRAKHRKAAARA